MSHCPICSTSSANVRTVGALHVLTCPTCGHGWLRDLAPDNDHFESAVYQSWRSSIRGAVEARAVGYVNDLVAVIGGVPESAAEIGCATGETIGHLGKLGATCWGVDTSEAAIDAAKSEYPMVTFTTALMPEPGQHVETVLMMHVIEHVHSPVETLRHARSLVGAGGTLYLRFPNYAGVAARVQRGTWPDYMADHVHYFTPTSMMYALAYSGWRELKMWTTASSWAWLGSAKRLIKGQRPTLTASGHTAPPSPSRMQTLARADRLLAPLLKLEAMTGRGNELVVIASARLDSME